MSRTGKITIKYSKRAKDFMWKWDGIESHQVGTLYYLLGAMERKVEKDEDMSLRDFLISKGLDPTTLKIEIKSLPKKESEANDETA